MAEVATALGCAKSSVSRWREGLIPAPSRRPRGRPQQLSGHARQRVLDALQKSPRQRGLENDRWTPEIASTYVRRVAGYEFSDRTVAVVLRALGFKLLRAGRGVPSHWIPGRSPMAMIGEVDRRGRSTEVGISRAAR